MFHENFRENAGSKKIPVQPNVMQKRYLLGTLKSKRKLQMSYKKGGAFSYLHKKDVIMNYHHYFDCCVLGLNTKNSQKFQSTIG